MANVNQPTNLAIKDRDVNQKLQLYGIFQAFSNGKAPSNKQIDVALNSFLESRALASPSSRLSAEGRALVGDVKDVVRQAKYLLLSKNQGDLLQEFLWDCQNIDGGNASTPNAPIDKGTAQQHGNQALDGLKTLARLVISNGQFRKLLQDVTVLARDMAGDAAQKAAAKVNPSEDQLNQIDEPAEDNTWHDAPDLSRENLKGQAKDTFNKNSPIQPEHVKGAMRQGQETADQHPSNDPRDAGSAGIKNAAQNLKQTAKENTPDEHKEKAQETKDAAAQRTKNYVNRKIPQERRDQTVYRLKKMVAEIQGHSDYQEAVDTLLYLAETYGGHSKNLAQQTTGTVKEAHGDGALQRAEKNLKTLLERFANYTSFDDLMDALNDIYADADRDPELRNWFKSMDRYIRKCLKEQGYIMQDSSTDEWNRLYDQGHHLLRERYRGHTDRVVDELSFLSDQFNQDPQNTEFANTVQKLFLDLGQDENGKPTFKPHLITDLTNVIIPAIFENTRYVPIPRIEVSDPMIDMVVENLVIESDNLFPNLLEFGNDNLFRMGRKGANSKLHNKIMIHASGIQMDLRDVAYYVKKKQGFPSITDKGVMDIILAGEGFGFKVAARNAQKGDRTHFIALDTIDVQIENLKINVKQSNHKLLFKIGKSILLKLMRPVIVKVIEKQIRNAIEKADETAYGVYQDAQKATEAAKNDPDNASNVFQTYFNAYQNKMTQKKEKAKQQTSQMEVNIAITKEDSIFPNINLPGGISTKATEYKQLAAKGDRWESPIFGLGSARGSSDIPKLRQVERKPHGTGRARIQGGNHPNAEGNYSSGQGVGSGGNYGSSGNYGSTGGEYGTGAGYGSGQGTGASGYGQGAGLGSQTGYNQGSGLGSQTGYNQGSGLGSQTGQSGTARYGEPGFSNQLDQAFDTKRDVTNGSANVSGANNTGGKTFYDGVTQ
ncbi:hypothetical protein PV11_03298 [Exophiala sideris]|uniref:Uncharacterized protein n=1 Tax=Exophiala sideris TaxID=1016849 RepID=A0A0D1XHW6_9EURO|nr:hypothetical protein PV11_03298 [Exophiala sideris]